MTGNGPHTAEFPIILKQAHDTNTIQKYCRGHLSLAPCPGTLDSEASCANVAQEAIEMKNENPTEMESALCGNNGGQNISEQPF